MSFYYYGSLNEFKCVGAIRIQIRVQLSCERYSRDKRVKCMIRARRAVAPCGLTVAICIPLG